MQPFGPLTSLEELSRIHCEDYHTIRRTSRVDPYLPRDKGEVDVFRGRWIATLLPDSGFREGLALALDDQRFGSSVLFQTHGFRTVVPNPFEFAGLLVARDRLGIEDQVILINMFVGQLLKSGWLPPHSLQVVDLDYMGHIGGNANTKPLEDVEASFINQKFQNNAVLFVTFTPARDKKNQGRQVDLLTEVVCASALKGGYLAECVEILPYQSRRLDSFAKPASARGIAMRVCCFHVTRFMVIPHCIPEPNDVAWDLYPGRCKALCRTGRRCTCRVKPGQQYCGKHRRPGLVLPTLR
jgi:hypothetical protein